MSGAFLLAKSDKLREPILEKIRKNKIVCMNCRSKLDNDIESLNVARTSNDTYINRLQHKIDLFEHNDLFVIKGNQINKFEFCYIRSSSSNGGT